MGTDVAPAPEFSRLISADQIGIQEAVRDIAANAAERKRLAERFDLLSLGCLTASLGLRRRPSGLIEVRGRFEAELIQACVVTLEPVPARLAEEFVLTFGAAARQAGGAVVVSVEGEDPPEEIVDGRIDLGEAVAQQLAVAIDPYPRSPAARAAGPGRFEDGSRDGEAEPANPFAALEALRRRRRGD